MAKQELLTEKINNLRYEMKDAYPHLPIEIKYFFEDLLGFVKRNNPEERK